MRGLFQALTAAALLSGSALPRVGNDEHGRIFLPLGVVDTQDDRRKRNDAAGGRKKRIARQKGRRSYGRRRLHQPRGTWRYRYVAPQTDGRIFLSAKRHNAFLESMAALEPIVGNYEARRAQAIKNARRVAA